MKKQIKVLIDRRTGYTYVPVTSKQCNDWGGFSICDTCGNTFEVGYLVYVLNSCICRKCLNKWLKRSVLYPEDLQMQKLYSEEYYRRHLNV